MVNAVIIVLLLAVLALAVKGAGKRIRGGCCGTSAPKIRPKDKNLSHYPFKETVYIDGMTCKNCKARVENEFNVLPDCFAKVNLKKKYAVIRTKKEMPRSEIERIITKCGYKMKGFSE